MEDEDDLLLWLLFASIGGAFVAGLFAGVTAL
jgi:hypothetical protein